jgi:hypothetical protein
LTKEKIKVHIKYFDLEKTFSGNVDEVWIALNKFFCEFVPAFTLSKNLLLTVDLSKLIEDCKDIIALSKEGVQLLVQKNKLSDNETLALYLLGAYIGYNLGILNNDSLSREMLQSKLGKSAKITSTRLGELVKNEIAKKTPDSKYKITFSGISRMQKDIIKIRSKIKK